MSNWVKTMFSGCVVIKASSEDALNKQISTNMMKNGSAVMRPSNLKFPGIIVAQYDAPLKTWTLSQGVEVSC